MGTAMVKQIPQMEIGGEEKEMRAITFLYHDVIVGSDYDSSGFAGKSAAVYKLKLEDFKQHINAISQVAMFIPALVGQEPLQEGPNLYLTFDDGGISALSIAETLNNYNWRGHFFITTDYLGTKTFLSSENIRALAQEGHVIGSHSCSHPDPMSACSAERLVTEWSDSKAKLEDILGSAVVTASLPGGYYSKNIAVAASDAGIKFLFTSEPVKTSWKVENCQVLGRYTLWRGMSPEVTSSIASNKKIEQLKQYILWNTKKIAKTLGGSLYLKLRQHLIR
jgi:peptidoglycan/xylan/chitin deacetylase (PgdA/CDA1 family)